MKTTVRGIFFDIGGTLRVSNPNEGRDIEKIEALMALIGENGQVDAFVERIHKGEKNYRRWCKPNYIELSEEQLWTRFLLPEYPLEFIRKHAITLNQLWRESRRKTVLPDMAETLHELARRGYKLGLISNTTSSVEGYQILDEAGLRDKFSCIILSAEFGRRKPNPSVFIEAARRAGLRPDECAYVGDRPSRDLIGARQSNYAAMVMINTEGYTTDEYDPDDFDLEKDSHLEIKPDYRIGRLAELLTIFPALNNQVHRQHESAPYRLYDVALSTMWHVDQKTSFNESFEIVRSLGISRFELNHQVTQDHLAEFDRDRNYISTVHDPCPAPESLNALKANDVLISSLNATKRNQAVDLVKRTIELAHRLGSRSVVLHTGSIICDHSNDKRLRALFTEGKRNSSDYEALKVEMVQHRASYAAPHLEAVKMSLLQILEFNQSSGLTIGIENRYRYYDLPLPDEMDDLLRLSGDAKYGFQFDTGHAHALEALGLCEKGIWLKRFSDRIIGVHLHDVCGIQDHQLPGEGDIDFISIAPKIPENCQKTIEIAPLATAAGITRCLDFLAASGCIISF